MNKTYAILAFVVLAGAIFAASSILGTTTAAIKDLCVGIKGLLPVAAMLMIVLAGVIYAAGQIMGAETRARANVWATACLTGALIAVLIAAVAPVMLNTVYGGSGVSEIGMGNSNIC